MAVAAILARGLSKRYRLVAPGASYGTLRDAIMERLRAPLRRGARAEAPVLWALRDVDLEIAPGDVVGLVGRNGAGKSTLLRILSRITPPTEGWAEIRGRVGSLLEVGTGFHGELSGRENVYMNGAVLGMRRREIERKFDEIVAFAEVAPFIDTPVKRYSTGMHMRLAFSVAAHLESEVLLVDEVLAVGDTAFQRRCLGRMQDLARSGRTVVFVSHNLSAVTQLCRSALWLESGRVKAAGAAADVVRDYLASGGSCVTERTWPDARTAPGDDRVRLRACRVLQGGRSTGVVSINEEVVVELEVDVPSPARNLVAGVSVYDAAGQCLTASCDWRPNDLAAGSYVKRLRVPPQTLAEGTFSLLVQCVFVDPHVASVVLPDVLRFEAIESEHASAVRGRYKGAWPGILRLALPWSEFESRPPEAGR